MEHIKQLESADIYMKIAIDVANKYNTPYGCVLVHKNTGIIESFANTTAVDGKTAHAEMNALRSLENGVGEDYILYSTGEPCPMCMGAIIWCGIKTVRYGLSIEEISAFHQQIKISSKDVADASWKQIDIEGGFCKDACRKLFEE